MGVCLDPTQLKTPGQGRPEKCIAIKLINQGCLADGEAELWSWARMSELLSLQTTNVWASYSHKFSANEDLVIGPFLRTFLCGTLTSSHQLVNSSGAEWLAWHSYIKPDVSLSLTDLSLSSSYPGRSWAPKLYLTPIQNGSFIHNGFSLVPSYTRHC